MSDPSGVSELRVHAVAVSAPAGLDRLSQLLAPDELDAVARLRRSADRARAVTGRAALRHLLGRRLGIAPAAVPLERGVDGKPQLAAERAGDVRFNVSHSGDRILVAVGRGREVGVDIEEVREDSGITEIAEHYFGATELAAIRSLPDERRVVASFTCWTLKEAYLKARGGGLDRPLNDFDVVLGWARRGRPRDAILVDEVEGWALDVLDVEAGYVAAISAAGAGPLPTGVESLAVDALTTPDLRP